MWLACSDSTTLQCCNYFTMKVMVIADLKLGKGMIHTQTVVDFSIQNIVRAECRSTKGRACFVYVEMGMFTIFSMVLVVHAPRNF